MLVLRNCSFVEALTEGTTLKNGDILIQDHKIDQIAPCGTVFDTKTKPDELDLHNATVMPGVIDMHIHLTSIRNSLLELRHMDPCNITLECLNYAKLLLDIGVTTIRECGDHVSRPVRAIKNAINAGMYDGPRIYEAGLIINGTDMNYELNDHFHVYVDGPMEMRKAVRETIAKGAQFIKLYGSGSLHTPSNIRCITDKDEIMEAVRIADSYDTYCAVHAHGAIPADMAFRCGVRTVEHASWIEDDTLRFIDGRRDMGIVPTISIMGGPMEAAKNGDEPCKWIVNTMQKSLKNAYQYDILIGWGTDGFCSGYLNNPGMEFQARKEFLEYSNIDILKQATINSAKLMMKDHEIGSVKEGKFADLIVVQGDPVDDIRVMYKKPEHVIKNGKLIR